MPDLLHEGGLIVAIFREKTREACELERTLLGREPDANERVADFSYQNESLAQMIVHAWTDPKFQNALLHEESRAKEELALRGIYLANPVVITEDSYNNGYKMRHRNEVVFVLPNRPRTAKPPPGQTLLETAKLLMACTPNGI
jgi:hypothetical protein